MSKHTPGPWFVCNTHDIFTGLGARNAEGTELPSNDGWHIADSDMGDLNIDEIRANARLIAAAPDLLEALQDLADQDFGSSGWDSYMDAIALRARAAIAKATGEPQ